MNKQAIVLYQSVTGFSRQYAQWIAQALGCSAVPLQSVDAKALQPYRAIVFGGGLYAGGVSGLRKFAKLYPAIRHKELVLFTCGLADPGDDANVRHIEQGIAKAIPAQLYAQLRQFHLRGGIDYSRLAPVHRAMMWMLCQSIRKRGYDTLCGDDKLLVDTYGKAIDFSDRQTIRPLVDYVLQKCAQKSGPATGG